MFSIITCEYQEERRDFLNLIKIQNQKENFMTFKLEIDANKEKVVNINQNKFYKMISNQLIYKYFSAIQSYKKRQLESLENHRELEVGHTSKLIHLGNVSLEEDLINMKIDDNELFCLTKRIRENRLEAGSQITKYIKRQLLKKIYFNNLHVLINLDAIYSQELSCINQYLKENNFKYEIIQPNLDANELNEDGNELRLYDIQLYCHETRFIIDLNSLNKTDKLMLYLLLLKRDNHLIKFNLASFYQVLLIDEIDILCNNNERVIDEALTLIRNNLVNHMNIQVISTVSYPKLIKGNNGFIMELSKKLNADQLILSEYNNSLSSSINAELFYINERRRDIDFGSRKQLERENKCLVDEVDKFKKKIQELKANIEEKEKEISALSSENEKLLEMKTRTLTPSMVHSNSVEVIRVIENSSSLSTEIKDYLEQIQNKGININIKLLNAKKN